MTSDINTFIWRLFVNSPFHKKLNILYDLLEAENIKLWIAIIKSVEKLRKFINFQLVQKNCIFKFFN